MGPSMQWFSPLLLRPLRLKLRQQQNSVWISLDSKWTLRRPISQAKRHENAFQPIVWHVIFTLYTLSSRNPSKATNSQSLNKRHYCSAIKARFKMKKRFKQTRLAYRFASLNNYTEPTENSLTTLIFSMLSYMYTYGCWCPNISYAFMRSDMFALSDWNLFQVGV